MSVLGVEYGCPYVLEGPDGMRIVFNDDTDEDFVGILGPESSGLDSADVREDATDATEEDGGHHGDFFEGRRPVVLVGTIIASSAKDRNEKTNKLKRASRALREDAILTWQPVGSPEVELRVRRQQPLRITKGFVKDFNMPLVAADIFPVGTTTHEESIEVKQQEKLEAGALDQSKEVGVSWDSLTPVKVSDNSRAKAPLNTILEKGVLTRPIAATTYGFALPSNSIIAGVRPSVERRKTGTETVKDNSLKLVVNDVYEGENQKNAAAWTTNDTVVSYGGASDTFGLPLTQAQVESTKFGFVITVNRGAEISETTAEIDHMSLRVYYMAESMTIENAGDAPAAPTLTISGPFDVPIEIENVTTEQKIVLDPPKLESGTLTIDFKNHTIMLNGETAYSWLQFGESEWFDLQPGENEIRFAGLHAGPKLTWQDTYL